MAVGGPPSASQPSNWRNPRLLQFRFEYRFHIYYNIDIATVPGKSSKFRQRYLYCTCNRSFVVRDRRCAQDRDKRIGVIVKEYTDSKSLRGAARSANVSATTAM